MSIFKKNLINCANICKESYSNYSLKNDETDTQVLIKEFEKLNIISWRGTENTRDWATNLDIDKDKTSYGEAHCGFLKAYKSICDELPKDKKTIITGHSLGGALALLNGIDFLENGIEVEGIYTFGQPRCLEVKTAAKLRKKYNNRIFRCVNNNDVVPRVPPRTLLFGHIGQLIYFDHNKELITNAKWSIILTDRIVGRVTGMIESILNMKTDGIIDHNIDEYIECVNNI